tara:strand:- start:46 stop:966 length:921 start_codon:yes stop_codon:yes gene_type:complete
MHIAVMGAGGVGGYFGGLLAAAGHRLTFVARGAHLRALREHGLTLSGARGELRLPNIEAVEQPEAGAPADVVLFCVKLYDTEEAGRLIAPLVGPESLIVGLQNGVDGPERLAALFVAERVLGGAAYVSARISAPGVVSYTSAMSSIAFGRFDGAVTPAMTAFADACEAAGFAATVSTDIEKTLWTKFLLLSSNAALSCLARQYVPAVYRDPDLRATVIASMREIDAVARARGIELDADAIDKACALSDGYPDDMTTSMHHDLMAGRRLELSSLPGYVVREGERLGVATPVNRVAWAALKPYLNGAP